MSRWITRENALLGLRRYSSILVGKLSSFLNFRDIVGNLENCQKLVLDIRVAEETVTELREVKFYGVKVLKEHYTGC